MTPEEDIELARNAAASVILQGPDYHGRQRYVDDILAGRNDNATAVLYALRGIRAERLAATHSPRPTNAEIREMLSRKPSEPEAWLIRETYEGRTSVLCGKMFKNEVTAKEAARRMTNRWRQYVAFPVVALEN